MFPRSFLKIWVLLLEFTMGENIKTEGIQINSTDKILKYCSCVVQPRSRFCLHHHHYYYYYYCYYYCSASEFVLGFICYFTTAKISFTSIIIIIIIIIIILLLDLGLWGLILTALLLIQERCWGAETRPSGNSRNIRLCYHLLQWHRWFHQTGFCEHSAASTSMIFCDLIWGMCLNLVATVVHSYSTCTKSVFIFFYRLLTF